MPAIDLHDTYKIIYYHKLLFLDRVTQTEKEKPRGYHEITSVFHGTKILSVLKINTKRHNKNRDRTLERWTWNPAVALGFLLVSLACVVILVVYRLFTQSCN